MVIGKERVKGKDKTLIGTQPRRRVPKEASAERLLIFNLESPSTNCKHLLFVDFILKIQVIGKFLTFYKNRATSGKPKSNAPAPT